MSVTIVTPIKMKTTIPIWRDKEWRDTGLKFNSLDLGFRTRSGRWSSAYKCYNCNTYKFEGGRGWGRKCGQGGSWDGEGFLLAEGGGIKPG